MKEHAIFALGAAGSSALARLDENGVSVWSRSIPTVGAGKTRVGRKGSFLTKEEAENLVLILCEKWGLTP